MIVDTLEPGRGPRTEHTQGTIRRIDVLILEGRPRELLAREDFEQLFLGAGQAAASEPEADEEENQDR